MNKREKLERYVEQKSNHAYEFSMEWCQRQQEPQVKVARGKPPPMNDVAGKPHNRRHHFRASHNATSRLKVRLHVSWLFCFSKNVKTLIIQKKCVIDLDNVWTMHKPCLYNADFVQIGLYYEMCHCSILSFQLSLLTFICLRNPRQLAMCANLLSDSYS